MSNRTIEGASGTTAVSRVEIVAFEPRYAADFKALNLEWLSRYFRVEPIDEVVLSDPEAILAAGGHILLARQGDWIVGTAALLKAGDRCYELSKMSVTAERQGQGIGRLLLEATLQVYRGLKAERLFLESNRRLTPALALYASVGFVSAERPPGPAHYERADVYMVYGGV